jgi:Domain of unknown function (DUF4926)
MIEPELFDIVELLIDLPEKVLQAGMQGAIVECFGSNTFEVEFSNDEGETIKILPLKSSQFVIVWRSKDNAWIPVTEKVAALLSVLPGDRQQQVFEFAKSLYTKV